MIAQAIPSMMMMMSRIRALILGAPMTIALAALALLATASWLAPARAAWAERWLLADSHAIAAGQWWRLATGPLIHATPDHLLWDSAFLLIIGLYYERRLCAVWPALVLCGLFVPTLAVLLAHPDMHSYFGLSGLTYALMAAAITHELARAPRRWHVQLAAGALAFKVGRDLVTSSPIFLPTELGESVHKVSEAHLAGALVGVLAVMGWRIAKRARDHAATPAWLAKNAG